MKLFFVRQRVYHLPFNYPIAFQLLEALCMNRRPHDNNNLIGSIRKNGRFILKPKWSFSFSGFGGTQGTAFIFGRVKQIDNESQVKIWVFPPIIILAIFYILIIIIIYAIINPENFKETQKVTISIILIFTIIFAIILEFSSKNVLKKFENIINKHN